MPTFQGTSQQAGVPQVARSMPSVRGFQSGESPVFEFPYSITGITKDSTGAVLASATLKLIRTVDDALVSQTVSDANGVYIMPASNVLQHRIDAYKAGSPDLAGTTVNTLVGA